MKKLLILSIIALFFSPAFAGNDNFPVGARSAGMGHASVTLSDVWSTHHNQAALAFLEAPTAGVYYENRYLLKELGLNAGAFALPTKTGTFGIIYHSFGFSQYRESKVGLSFGKKLGETFALGIGLNYNSVRLGDIYGNSSTLTAELSCRYQVNESLSLGTQIYNLNRAKLANYNNEYIPTIIRFGLQYNFSKKLITCLESQLDIEHDLVIKAGLEYQILEHFTLRGGISTQPTLSSFGFGYSNQNFKIDLALSYHQVLGFSPQVGLVFAFSKKDEKVVTE